MGLAKPVEQLQNALSFNYYANTEIYDERAVWTEDTSALDKEVFDAIKSSQDIPTPKITNQQSNEGGETIGIIKTTTPVPSGETGEIVYQKVMDSLIDTAKTYFTTTTNQLEKIVVQNNNGILQLISFYDTNRQYTSGTVGGVKSDIYGKPQYEKTINYIFDNCISKFNNKTDIICSLIVDKGYDETGNNEKYFTILRQNLKQYVENLKPTFSSDIAVIINDLVKSENDLIYSVSRLNVVNDQFDGKISGSVVKLYQTSGSTKPGAVGANSGGVPNTYEEFKKDYGKLSESLNKYLELLKTKEILKSEYSTIGSYQFTKIDQYNGDEAYKVFFLVMSRIMTDDVKFQEFRSFVLSPNIDDNKFIKKFDSVCEDLKKDYKKELEKEQENFTKFKNTSEYKNYDSKIEQTLYPKGKTRQFDFTTITDPNKKSERESTIKNIYGTVNYGDKANDFSTFDGKINI
jgi:hypothetical protein